MAWSVFVAIGSAGGTLSLMDKGWDILVVHTEPEIHAPEAAADILSLPFSIKNPSPFFTMYDLSWICGIGQIKGERIDLSNFGITSTQMITVPPGGVALVQCLIHGITKNMKATIFPIVNYKTLMIIPRHYEDKGFTWLPDASPPHWIEGVPMDLPKPITASQ